jgi:PAS domain S-box-containing protein
MSEQTAIEGAAGDGGARGLPPTGLPPHPDRLLDGSLDIAGSAANVLNTVEDCFIVLDGSWRCLYVNRRTCELTQKTEEELLGRCITKVLPDFESSNAYKLLRDAITDKRRGVALDPFVDETGEARWYETTVHPFGANVLCVSRDVTQRESIRVEVENKNVRMETFVNNIPDMAWIKDVNSKFIVANKAFCNAVGMSHEYLVNNTCDVCFGELATKFKADDRAVMASGMQKRIEESIIDGVTKEVVWLETVKSPLRDAAGAIVGTVGIARDITERKRLNAALNTSSRMAGMADVAISVLHNVGNALTSVNVSASLMSEKLQSSHLKVLAKVLDLLIAHEDDLPAFISEDTTGKMLVPSLIALCSSIMGERDEMTNEMRVVQDHLEQIMHTISLQQEHASVTTVVEKCALDQLVQDALAFILIPCREKHIRVTTEVDEMLDITLDRHQVVQILANLLLNAVDALDGVEQAAKVIKVVGKKSGDEHFCVQVADNGVGISQDERPRVFTYGFSTKDGRHGFSLHNASNMAQAMGGTLSFLSDGKNRGSVFSLQLPIVR